MAILGPITSERRLRDFAVVDLEWVPAPRLAPPVNTLVEVEGIKERFKITLPVKERRTGPLELRIAGYYDEEEVEHDGETVARERYECETSMAALLELLFTRENRGRWFFMHAGGLYDIEFVLDEVFAEIKSLMSDAGRSYTVRKPSSELEEVGVDWVQDFIKGTYKVRASFSGSSAIIVHVSKGKNSWHFVDSYWLLRDKLASIGKAISVRKGDTPEAVAWLKQRFGKDNFEALDDGERVIFYREAPIRVLTSYNRVDCAILFRAIKQFESEIWELGGQLQQTIASTGMNLCRRSYLKREICTSEKINKVAEESYFASRVEVVSRNALDFLMYDINSSFPYSMTFPQPAGLRELRSTLPDDDSEECIYIADVTIEVPDMVLPPVPYRVDGRVFFPVGRWRSWLTSTDIKLALREGCTLHKVHEVYVFEPFYDLRDYATDIYAKRAATDVEFRRLVLKYLLNSLYGKYAESPWKQELLMNPAEIDRGQMQLLQPGVWLREKQVPIAHRHVPISTHITAIARRTLYDFAKECYRQNEQLYYCDTDSLATRADLPVDEKKLGALKLEKKLLWANFIAPKIYLGEGFKLRKDGTWEEDPTYMAKAKGFSLDKIEMPGVEGTGKRAALEKLEKIAAGDRAGVQRMTRVRELYRTREEEGYAHSPFEVLVIKALTFEMLSKRFHYPDGETRPWSVAELESGDVYPRGFDFEQDILDRIDTTTRSMMEAAV